MIAFAVWIVNNAEKNNVKMVIHTGDLVEDEGNTLIGIARTIP
jgi:DNA repair exonuclease SbcCD nuclease subunit